MPPPNQTSPEDFAQLLARLAAPLIAEALKAAPKPPAQAFPVTRMDNNGAFSVPTQVTLPQALTEMTDNLKITVFYTRQSTVAVTALTAEIQALRAELETHRKLGEEIARERAKRKKRHRDDDDEET